MSEFKYKEESGVNYDYILALKENENQFSVEQISINRNKRWETEMIDIYNDTNCDVVDMYLRIKSFLQSTDYVYPFCLGYSYDDSFIDYITIPKMDVREYRKYIELRQNYIVKAYKEHNYDKGMLMGMLNRLYAEIKEDKTKYLNYIMPYIYSYNYYNTIQENKVKQKYNIFSAEIHGKFTYESTVNENLKIAIQTNFCYGSSSYFHVVVTYKGIELLPFSEWVKYYFARYNSIMRYTRAYECYRKSWHYALNFLAGYVNKAIHNPDEFVKGEILSEVNDLMSGLENIFRMNDAEFESRLDVQHIEEDDDRFIGISSARHANERERQNYKIRTSECAMIFKMEKISGALHFLKNLTSLTEILPDVENIISRIIELNQIIYPSILEAIPPIKDELKSLIKEDNKIQHLYEVKSRQLEPYKIELKNIKEKASRINYEDIECEFKENNPQYKILTEEVNTLWTEHNRLFNMISNREDVIERLNSYKDLIDRYI